MNRRQDVLRAASRRRAGNRRRLVLLALLLAAGLHGAGLYLGGKVMPYLVPELPDAGPISLVVLQPPDEEDEVAVDEEDPLDDLRGQIVETAKPKDPQRPEDADYLAEHDTVVEKEMRSELFQINPEVVAPEFSEESKLEYESVADVNIDEPSTGAQVGGERFDPSRDGSMATLPSEWTFTNLDGLQKPTAASHRFSTLSGAPQNDLLDVEVGPATQLNTKEILFASYLLRIRRLVNFYWEQNLSNLPRTTRIARPRYTTGVMVVLDGDGAIQRIDVSEGSGVPELDDAVVRAYRLAGPFPNPPEQLIAKDGRVYLPLMTWTVTFGRGTNQFTGVDPNAGVQFPGLLKSPR